MTPLAPSLALPFALTTERLAFLNERHLYMTFIDELRSQSADCPLLIEVLADADAALMAATTGAVPPGFARYRFALWIPSVGYVTWLIDLIQREAFERLAEDAAATLTDDAGATCLPPGCIAIQTDRTPALQTMLVLLTKAAVAQQVPSKRFPAESRIEIPRAFRAMALVLERDSQKRQKRLPLEHLEPVFADIGANRLPLFPCGHEGWSQDLVDLVVKLDTERNSGKSDRQIALEFSGEPEYRRSKAASLMTQFHRHVKAGKLNLSPRVGANT